MRRIGILICALALVVSALAQAQDLKPVRDKQTKKYGYQGKDKSWVIQPVYDGAKRFVDGYAVVELDGRKGLIDANGNVILQTEYDNIGKFDNNGLCELMQKEGKTKWYGVADRAGTIILPVDCRNVNIPKKGGYITAERMGSPEGFSPSLLWGIYDMQGREICAPQFLSSPSYSNGTFIVKSAETGLTGVVSEDGKTLLPFKYLTVSRYSGNYDALSTDFTRTRFSGNLHSEEISRFRGAITPYDPMGDPVRAAAWHSGCIGVRMHRNTVKLLEWQDRRAYCSDLRLDWGQNRFLRLEPFVDEPRHDGAMEDPASGKYYTLKAVLYEADGTRGKVISDWGWLEGEYNEGAVYHTDKGERWMLFEDVNCPYAPSFTLSVGGYREIRQENIYTGLVIRSADVERLADPHNFASRLKDICEGDNVGLDSYTPRATELRNLRQARELMRAPFFRYPYSIGEVVSCTVGKRGEDMEVTLYEQLVCHFEDRLEYPGYSMSGDEVIYWGPHNGRTVRMSLEGEQGSSDALLDDITGSNTKYRIVLSLYEEDGSWLRTLGVFPYVDFIQDGVLVFEKAGIAVLTPESSRYRKDYYGRSGSRRDGRGSVQRTIKIPGAQRLPHTLSALRDGAGRFPESGFSGRRPWSD